MDNIFVSYSRTDSQLVDRLIWDLQNRGYQIWVDRADIAGGDAWRASISDSIRACKAFLLVLSPRSVLSQHVATELELADQHGRTIIPILYQQPSIPPRIDFLLGGVQHIDLAYTPYNQALDQLDRTLGNLPSVPTSKLRIGASDLGRAIRPRLPRVGGVSVGSSRRKWIIIVIVVCVALAILICLCNSLLGSTYYYF